MKISRVRRVCCLIALLATAGCVYAQPPVEAHKPTIVPGLDLKLVWIAPGTFTMGSPDGEPGRRANEGPQTKVTLTHGYWLGAYEVTNGQWKAMMGTDVVAEAHAAQIDDKQYLISGKTMMYLRDFARVKIDTDPAQMVGNTDDKVPIIWASWEGAIAFCHKLTERERAAGRLPAGYEYRLPTEAEWEYAARAGTTEATYAGEIKEILPNGSAAVLDSIAWYSGNSGVGYQGHSIDSSNFSEKKEYSAGKAGPRDIGTKKPNQWGLYDMLGNAAEWTMDWSGPYPGGSVTDWKGPPTGTYRVRRGGGWSSNATLTRAAYRNWHEPTYRWSNLGFRVALAPVEAPATSSSPAAEIRDSIAVQQARNARMTERGKKVSYTEKFDLSNLPRYVPEQKVAGSIRVWGSNYFADGNVASYWEEGFRKYHPDATFVYNLKAPTSAVPAIYTGVADVAVGKVTFESTLAFQRVLGHLPLQITAVTGSLNVAGWHDALCIFVHKDNPITHLSIKQLDGIFGAMRSGGWQGIEWHPEFARGPEGDIRTWGQLGLAGQWADKPIHVYGLNTRDGAAITFSNKILKGSDKWNENVQMFANYARPDGSLAISATVLVEQLGKDPYGIGFGGIQNLTPQTKVLALATTDDGPFVEPNLITVQNRTYPLYDEVYVVADRAPGHPLAPKVKEYLRYILSQEGQEAVARDGKYLPLTAQVVQDQLKKLQ